MGKDPADAKGLCTPLRLKMHASGPLTPGEQVRSGQDGITIEHQGAGGRRPPVADAHDAVIDVGRRGSVACFDIMSRCSHHLVCLESTVTSLQPPNIIGPHADPTASGKHDLYLGHVDKVIDVGIVA